LFRNRNRKETIRNNRFDWVLELFALSVSFAERRRICGTGHQRWAVRWMQHPIGSQLAYAIERPLRGIC
jgi:hypothetical protein